MIATLGQIPRIPEDEFYLLPFDLRSDPIRLIPCPYLLNGLAYSDHGFFRTYPPPEPRNHWPHLQNPLRALSFGTLILTSVSAWLSPFVP